MHCVCACVCTCVYRTAVQTQLELIHVVFDLDYPSLQGTRLIFLLPIPGFFSPFLFSLTVSSSNELFWILPHWVIGRAGCAGFHLLVRKSWPTSLHLKPKAKRGKLPFSFLLSFFFFWHAQCIPPAEKQQHIWIVFRWGCSRNYQNSVLSFILLCGAH